MNQPIIESMSAGCPHCPTRRQCACPDGPEKCPDNADCPCDKTVCPCGKHAHRPEPPGCLHGTLARVVGALAVLAVIVVAILILRGGDDNSTDNTQIAAQPTPTAPVASPVTDPVPSAAPTTAAPTTATPTTQAPAPGFAPPTFPSGGSDEISTPFGGASVISSDFCLPATPRLTQVDQVGGSPLTDPSLVIDATCLQRVTLDGSQVPMLTGDFLIAATVHQGPLTSETNIAYQPGIAFDRPGVDNATPQPSGEGILQVPVDVAGFGVFGQGWQQATFFALPGFAASDISGYSYAMPGSRVTAFAIPSDQIAPDTIVYLQSFGRQTPPGAAAAVSDPAASTLVIAGSAPCGDTCTVEPGRFTVEATWATDPSVNVAGVESPDGSFWFFTPDNVELVVKVLNACEASGFNSYWVLAGSLTDVDGTLTFTDTQAGDAQTYTNPLGRAVGPILDTEAFATCP